MKHGKRDGNHAEIRDRLRQVPGAGAQVMSEKVWVLSVNMAYQNYAEKHGLDPEEMDYHHRQLAMLEAVLYGNAYMRCDKWWQNQDEQGIGDEVI